MIAIAEACQSVDTSSLSGTMNIIESSKKESKTPFKLEYILIIALILLLLMEDK